MKTFFKLLALAGVLALLFGCGGSSNNDDVDVDVDDGVADAACGPVVDISENAMVSGRLEEGDCVLSTIFPDLTTHAYVDEYRVTLAISGDLTITMRSSQFASYIYIVDTTETCSGGCDVAIILDEDAFSGGGLWERMLKSPFR